MRPASRGIDHHLGVAVIRRYDQRAAHTFHRIVDAADASVNRFYRFDRGLDLPGMSHHVRVRKVHHQTIHLMFFHRFRYRVGDARRAHLRLQVVGSDFRRGNHHALLAGIGLFLAAIEKVRDVSVLFRFRDTHVAQARILKHVGQDIGRRKRLLYERRLECLVVARHRHGIDAVSGQQAGHLPGAIRPEIEVDHRVFRPDNALWGDHRRLHELVRNTGFVTRLHSLYGGRRGAPFALGHRVVSAFGALPTPVAIHGVIAARHRRDAAHAVAPAFRFQRFEESRAAFRRCVAAVHESMDENTLHLLLGGHAQQGVHMI